MALAALTAYSLHTLNEDKSCDDKLAHKIFADNGPATPLFLRLGVGRRHDPDGEQKAR